MNEVAPAATWMSQDIPGVQSPWHDLGMFLGAKVPSILAPFQAWPFIFSSIPGGNWTPSKLTFSLSQPEVPPADAQPLTIHLQACLPHEASSASSACRESAPSFLRPLE